MAGKERLWQSLWIALLTFSAGFTNAEMTVGRYFSVSHHSGNLSQFAIAISQGSPALLLLSLIFFFLVGSIVAGLIFYKKDIGKAARYGTLSLIHGSITILLSLWLPSHLSFLFILFQSLAFGVQNGILKSVGGMLTRTTHMTGYLTDAGVALGRVFRGDKQALWKFWYFAAHLLIFLVGAYLGAHAFLVFDRQAATIAGVLQCVPGMIYLLSRDKNR